MGLDRKVKIDAKLIEIIIELHSTFIDYDKIEFWLHTNNLNLGGCSPIRLIERGRANKVLEYILASRES